MSYSARVSLETAAALLLQHIPRPSQTEVISLQEAVGRICSAPVTASLEQPPFHRSPLDGYALRSADSSGASMAAPVTLQVVGQLYAGDSPRFAVGPGQAVRIMTGAPIPSGADCVIRQESTNYGTDSVQIFSQLSPYENFCFKGEDIHSGDVILKPGQKIDWTYIGVLAVQGIASLSVYRRPTVGVITTGDELLPIGTPPSSGKIYDSNGPLLAARLQTLGAVPVTALRSADDPAAIADAIRAMAENCDMILTTGGVSVGEKDYLPAAAGLLRAEVLFHGIAAKPGSPTMAMLFRDTPILSLSGNPFAAAAIFEVLGRPAIEQLAGHSGFYPQRTQASLCGDYQKASPSRRLLRARLAGCKVTIPPEGHSSGMLSKFAGCNCLIDIPAGSPCILNGEQVAVYVF